jgi:hypothetical protein
MTTTTQTITGTRNGKSVTLTVEVTEVNGTRYVKSVGGKALYGTTGYWPTDVYADGRDLTRTITSYRGKVLLDNVQVVA